MPNLFKDLLYLISITLLPSWLWRRPPSTTIYSCAVAARAAPRFSSPETPRPIPSLGHSHSLLKVMAAFLIINS